MVDGSERPISCIVPIKKGREGSHFVARRRPAISLAQEEGEAPPVRLCSHLETIPYPSDLYFVISKGK